MGEADGYRVGRKKGDVQRCPDLGILVLPAVVLPSTGLGKSAKKAGPVRVKGREFNSEYIS